VLSLLALTLLSADPAPVVEFDLRQNGVTVRTDDDLDSSQWGKIPGATHLFMATVVRIGKTVSINGRVVHPQNQVAGVARSKSMIDLEPFVALVLQKVGLPVPPSLKLLTVNEELLLAWGAALDAVHDGSPDEAKKKVAEVAKKWPNFTPAQERLKQL
jgi:hypothetical protein